MRPVSQSILHDCSIDILWNCAHVFNKSYPNWSGYMSSFKTNYRPLKKSVITVLPVINLHATDTTVLYSFLSFVTDKSSKLNVPTPSITFDQPLYVKAYNIVSSMNMNIYVRLGGFHQLMSWMFNGREWSSCSSRRCICSCYCWSYVFWQGFCPCNTWSYVYVLQQFYHFS